MMDGLETTAPVAGDGLLSKDYGASTINHRARASRSEMAERHDALVRIAQRVREEIEALLPQHELDVLREAEVSEWQLLRTIASQYGDHDEGARP